MIVKLLMICMLTIQEMNTLRGIRLADHTGYLLRVAHDQAHRTKIEASRRVRTRATTRC